MYRQWRECGGVEGSVGTEGQQHVGGAAPQRFVCAGMYGVCGGDMWCVCGADNKTLGDDGAVAVGDAVAAGHMTSLKTLYIYSQ